MGLDISFPLKEAIDAGLEPGLGVSDFRDQGAEKQELELLGRLPNTSYWFELTVLTNRAGIVNAFVRANHWGPLFEPLTAFLNEHNIPWEES